MLITLIHRELLDNLMTFRFAATVFIMLLLVVTNTAVLIKDYERRLAAHNDAVKMHQRQLDEKKTYSAGRVYADRPPNPLSIFSLGLDKRLGNQIEVSHKYVPSLWDAYIHESDNPFMDMFASMDIVFIFEVILSLLALIFAYDALAGEYERGTLRLVLTHPVQRGHILLSKYISAMFCLLVPLLISILLSIILMTISASISLSPGDFLRIGGLILTSVMYLSIFYLIGLLISATNRRMRTALMLSMFVWGFLVLVYPNVILAVFPHVENQEVRRTSAFNQIEQMWEEFDRKRKHFLATDDFPGEDWGLELRGWGSRHAFFSDNPRTLLYTYESVMQFDGFGEEDEHKMPYAQNHFRFLGSHVTATADRTWLTRKPVLEDIFIQQANMERALLKLSPVGIYDAVAQAWAGTDLNGIRDFFETTRQYRRTVINYFTDKDVFGSRQWFSADKGAADWRSLPKFSFQRSSVEVNVKRALPEVCLLLLINLFMFLLIFLIFHRREV